MQNKSKKKAQKGQATTQTTLATLTAPVKKREPIKDKKEYDRRPVLVFDRPATKWQDDSITMDEDEFRVMLKTKLRILHTECIGYDVSEEDETYEKNYQPINVIIYGSNGYLRNEPEQQTVYAFYVRYQRYLWSTWDILGAIKIIESIRQGLLLRQKKYNEAKKRRSKR